jgi:predicted HNH restriction endonuclease
MTLEELNKEVLRVARRYRGSTNQVVSYEDVAQEVWAKIITNKELDEFLADDRTTLVKKINVRVSQVIDQTIHDERYWAESGYYYSPSTVRYGLENGFGCTSIQTHYAKAFKMLEHSYPKLAIMVTRKYTQQDKLGNKERMYLTRAIDRIAEYMNDLYASETRNYEGPGSRKAVSNSTGRMWSSGTWNKNEYAEDAT